MSSNDILECLRELMSDVLDTDDVVVDENTTAHDVEDWDSLSHIRLIVAVEQKFGIRFQNSEVENLQNVGDLVKVIEAKVAQLQPGH